MMSEIRNIEARPIENRYARGWHCLGAAADLKDRKPHQIDAFGTRLVAYLGEDDRVHVLQSYCPHMGGDLSKGTIRGNSILCPFHHWSWDASGRCVEIPYCDKVPPRAVIRSWPTCEQNQLLFIWNDPERHAPTPELTIPRIDACFSDDWSPWVIEKWTINTNCRELIDNVADKAHFAVVHSAPADYFANIFEGHRATQIIVGNSTRPEDAGGLQTCATYFGPAYQITEMKADAGGFEIESILLNCHVPITLNSFDLRFGMLVRKVPGLSDERNAEIAANYIKLIQLGFYQDVAIWDNKVRVDNPLLCVGDGPIAYLRRWYEQFYLDTSEVPEEMSARRVFEMGAANGSRPKLRHVFEE